MCMVLVPCTQNVKQRLSYAFQSHHFDIYFMCFIFSFLFFQFHCLFATLTPGLFVCFNTKWLITSSYVVCMLSLCDVQFSVCEGCFSLSDPTLHCLVEMHASVLHSSRWRSFTFSREQKIIISHDNNNNIARKLRTKQIKSEEQKFFAQKVSQIFGKFDSRKSNSLIRGNVRKFDILSVNGRYDFSHLCIVFMFAHVFVFWCFIWLCQCVSHSCIFHIWEIIPINLKYAPDFIISFSLLFSEFIYILCLSLWMC